MYEREQLRALIDTAVDGIISISAKGEIRLFSKGAERIFGYTAEEAAGQNISLFMPPDIGAEHDHYLSKYLESGEPQIIGVGRRVNGRRADGSVFPMHLSVGEFLDGDEHHFVGIIHDLTEEIAERERTQALKDQLETIGRHSAVSEMGAALAHELNQPLTAIDLFLAAAERQLTTDPEKAKQTFLRVREEATRAGNIVKRIRTMEERSDGEQVSFLLSEVIDSAVELCRTVDHDRRVVRIETIPPVMMFGDPTQIRMILVNLIKNGLDATESDPRAQVVVRASHNTRVQIEVLDNGPGVREDFMEKLFEPFSSTKDRGLGIGLSICRTIAEGHGGTLEYLPREEQQGGLGGAMFRLELPMMEAD